MLQATATLISSTHIIGSLTPLVDFSHFSVSIFHKQQFLTQDQRNNEEFNTDKAKYIRFLLNPGPQMVIFDDGKIAARPRTLTHITQNPPKSKIAKSVHDGKFSPFK